MHYGEAFYIDEGIITARIWNTGNENASMSERQVNPSQQTKVSRGRLVRLRLVGQGRPKSVSDGQQVIPYAKYVSDGEDAVKSSSSRRLEVIVVVWVSPILTLSCDEEREI